MTQQDPYWIGAPDAGTAPLLRREFTCPQSPVRATLLISGLGCHEVWMNGARVGDHVLDPAQTDYERRVLYVRHDVSDLLRAGANALGVVLGNGWYNQDKVWQPDGLSYGKPRLTVELQIDYDSSTVPPAARFGEGGTGDTIRTDDAWRWANGPITENNLYAGECYDARREVDGWCEPGFDDSDWAQAVCMDAPGGELVEQTMPPIREIDTLMPIAMRSVGEGVVVDFGQNFAGWTRICVDAPVETEIVMRSAETVFPDGRIDTSTTGVFATGVEQVERYISKGGGTQTWEPRFTYHGLRYVEITGWPGELTADDIVGVVVHNDLPVVGSFECSDDRLNTLHQMALWTHRSNCHGIPEDCPAREKCGWLGDANLVAEYSLWNYDAKTFWEKYLGDIETARSFNDGIPGDVAPGKRFSRPDGYSRLVGYIYHAAVVPLSLLGLILL